MKKYKLIFLFLLIIVSSLFITNNANATTGGPSYIHTFKYNPLDESVYYIKSDFGGRGCPPELIKISLNTGKSETVYSCDQGEKLIEKSNDYTKSLPLINSEINKIIVNFKPLTRINLNENKIAINIDYVNSQKWPAEYNFGNDAIKNINFTAIIYQNNTKLTDLSISGCKKEQPFTFAGYAIPGFEKKIILLSSAISNCWEGGYVYENLYLLGGVDNLNKVFYSNSIKENSALTPDNGTLVVMESEKINETVNDTPKLDVENEVNNTDINTTNNISKDNFNTITIIIVAIASIIVGVFLGKLFRKKNNGSI